MSNGGCAQQCEFDYTHLDFMCSCVDGYVLHEDRKSCIEQGKTYISVLSEP